MDFSLTEGTSKGSQLSSKRGIHRNTQSVKQKYRQPAADRKGSFQIHRGFSLKSTKVYCFKHSNNFSLEKHMFFYMCLILVIIFLLKASQSSFSLCRCFSKHLHKEIACFFPTVGGDGSRQSSSDTAIFIRVL